MLTLPDLREKQILFVQADGASDNHLFFRNENIVFKKDGKIVNQASCHKIIAVFVVGDFSITSKLMKECKERAVSLFFLNRNFKSYASINAKADGNYILRSMQYAMTPEREVIVSRNIVLNKILNQAELLKIAGKGFKENFSSDLLMKVNSVSSSDELLGIEGSASKIFFKEYFSDMGWWRRMPRVKNDVPNFLLDMGYTFLFNFVDSLLLLFGFDTFKGCYHKLFFQRKSLACDVVEPFRCIIDKQLLKSHHLKQINEKDFFIDQGRYALEYTQNRKYAKIFMEAIMEVKEPIYLYVHGFYRFMMDKGDFPHFDVTNKEVK